MESDLEMEIEYNALITCIRSFAYRWKILTNMNQRKRGYAVDYVCGYCGAHESILHVLRDFNIVERVWDELGVRSRSGFLVGELHIWPMNKNNIGEGERNCEVIFVVAIWYLRRARNGRVFLNMTISFRLLLSEISRLDESILFSR